MAHHPTLPVTFALALSLPATGLSEPLPLLSGADLARELFGIHMFGFETGSGMLFDECIEPTGRTVYRTRMSEREAPYSQPGQLLIRDTGLACFSYPPQGDPTPACFEVYRDGDGYVFQSIDGPSRFAATEVLRGVSDCPEPGEFVS